MAGRSSARGCTRAQDGDFSEQRFRDIVNAAMANSVGNLANRALSLLHKNCAAALPAAASEAPASDPLRACAEEQARGLDLRHSCRWLPALSASARLTGNLPCALGHTSWCLRAWRCPASGITRLAATVKKVF